MKRILFLVLVFINTTLIAQTGVIKGRVIDSKTLEPLPFANVFVNNTTIGTTTDVDGNFVLKNVSRPSVVDLVISFVGYQSFKQKISLSEETLSLKAIKLIASEIELSNVEVKEKRDVEWEKKLKKFKKIFLGDDKMAEQCAILNSYVLDFPELDKSKKFTAIATSPLEIENKALGYKVHFYLSRFSATNTEYLIEGNVRVEELPEDETLRSQWKINREKAYGQSRQHLFKSIVNQRIKGEGFNLYTETTGAENIRTRSAFFESEIGKNVKRYDTTNLVTTTSQKGVYKIVMTGRMEVHYTKERATLRTYRDVFFPVSWIQLTKGYVLVNKEGVELNPADVITSGDMNKGRVAQMLPLDYVPGTLLEQLDEDELKVRMAELYEKIYIHTDKPYYYPGELVWFKGYLNYASPLLRDSLSQTAYVELIDRKQEKVLLSNTVKIDSGLFHGELLLPDTLKAGSFYLRSYTNWNRNFGPENFFLKPLPVLDLMERVEPQSGTSKHSMDSNFVIVKDKQVYKPRERIVLTLKLNDENGQPLPGNLSLSVTDAAQVIPIESVETILTDFNITPPKIDDPKKFSSAVEYGVSFTGQFTNKQGAPQKELLNIIEMSKGGLSLSQSDEEGKFLISNLRFYDTTAFSVRPIDPKKQEGLTKQLPRDVPDVKFIEKEYSVQLIKTPTKQRQGDYTMSKDTRLLDDVEITSKRLKIAEEYKDDFRVKRPYGKPDFVLKGKDIDPRYGNLLQTLPGKVPGLIVDQVNNPGEGTVWVVYLKRGISITMPPQVIVTIDDAMMMGLPADILGAINPETVASVEVKKGVNVLYGGFGGGGIVSVYLKKGLLEEENKKRTPPMEVLKVSGYSRPGKFQSPDYSQSVNSTKGDYRSLLYWNPQVIINKETGTATVSFYSSDLEGLYNIVVEGITGEGKPVSATSFVEVKR
ncbi:MAG TPA: carboxypeptidase-like regulatory domain-containing protein [Cyclobacteriaceae bacterium]